jgi:hypothetical protein
MRKRSSVLPLHEERLQVSCVVLLCKRIQEELLWSIPQFSDQPTSTAAHKSLKLHSCSVSSWWASNAQNMSRLWTSIKCKWKWSILSWFLYYVITTLYELGVRFVTPSRNSRKPKTALNIYDSKQAWYVKDAASKCYRNIHTPICYGVEEHELWLIIRWFV